MSDVTATFDIGIPIDEHPGFIKALRAIFKDTDHENPFPLGPFTVKFTNDDGVVAEVAWRGQVFAKFMPATWPDGQDEAILFAQWSEGGSPKGEWFFGPYSLGDARAHLVFALENHAERILEGLEPRVRDAGAALAMLALNRQG